MFFCVSHRYVATEGRNSLIFLFKLLFGYRIYSKNPLVVIKEDYSEQYLFLQSLLILQSKPHRIQQKVKMLKNVLLFSPNKGH